jgi:hypothetical protein
MTKQLDLFDLSAIAPPPPVVYDPLWDKDDTFNSQLTSFDNSSPEFPSSQESFFQTVLEQDTAVTLPVVEYLEKLGGDRHHDVLERDTKNAVPEQKAPVPEQKAPVPQHIQLEFLQWVEQYSPSTRKGHLYYRYCYKQGRKIHHIHITGGNTRLPIVQSRKSEVESAITDGQTPSEIQDLIRSWRKS